MHTVITGGAGLIGSHLVVRLLDEGHRVTVIDNLRTGRRANLFGVQSNSALTCRDGDVCDRALFSNLAEMTEIAHSILKLDYRASAEQAQSVAEQLMRSAEQARLPTADRR